jgi:DNA-binding CsgD family transcriptional regulator
MAPKRNKSDSYQHKIIEISVDPSILNDFAMSEGLGFVLNTTKFSEEFFDLRQQLIQEVLRVVGSCLTKRQAEVVGLRLIDLTQIQIAEQLGIHQTTVHKLLMGNIDYANGKKRYGGAIKKLKKVCSKDSKVIFLLEEMEKLRTKELEDVKMFDFGDD